MCDLEDNKDLFSWEELGEIESNRPNLGQTVPVSAYRALQYAIRHVLSTDFDSDLANKVLYKAGKLAGEKFYKQFLGLHLDPDDFFTELKKVLLEQKIGILRIEKADIENMEFLLTIAEDLDCSGLPFIDMVVCDYDEGFIAGIMKAYTGRNFSVKEIDCWGTGDRVCRFLVNHPE